MDVDALALGIEADAVFRMTMRLGDLADIARQHPAVAAALREGVSLSELATIEGAEAFRSAFDAFLEEYGFRAVGEIDWSRPRYREDPGPLVNAIASALETSDPGEHRLLADRLAERADTAEQALRRAADPHVRPFVARLSATYRTAIGLREHPKFALARVLAALREPVLEAGASLAAAGALPDDEAVWFLTREELMAGLEDRRSLAGVAIADRRQRFERVRAMEAPRILTSDGEVATPLRADSAAEATLRGTGAAPGVVEGVVRVVTDPATERLRRGEILVASYTDPGWTPLFLTAGAIVTEVGGRLTHGSLVAREYGIPAVVSVDDATRTLRTGDRVRVDGSRGVVERLDQPRDRPTPAVEG